MTELHLPFYVLFIIFYMQFLFLMRAKDRVLTMRTEELTCIQFIFGRRLVLFHPCSFLVKADSRELSPTCDASRD